PTTHLADRDRLNPTTHLADRDRLNPTTHLADRDRLNPTTHLADDTPGPYGGLRAVLHFVPLGPDGASLGLMRRDRAADPGVDELLIVAALQAEGLLRLAPPVPSALRRHARRSRPCAHALPDRGIRAV
ncbi:hypothetical protein ACIQ6Y_15860, partial [Streptomyces sp. NPDC096205]